MGRPSPVRLLPLTMAATLLGACARPPLGPMRDPFVTIAAVGSGNSIWGLFGEPIARGQHYAVIDDRGYVGTLRVESVMPCLLACIECCTKAQWWTKWVEPPERVHPKGLVLAIGPVDGRYASARRELPSVDLEGNPWEWSFVRSESFRTLVRFSFGSEPAALEARGRRVDGARMIELRVRHRGAWRIVSRTVEKSDPGPFLDKP